jgi:hypothetical protein
MGKTKEREMEGKPGDRIVVESEHVGSASREGEVLERLAGAEGVRYRVRWSDGRESVFTPGAGSARIVPSARARRRTA